MRAAEEIRTTSSEKASLRSENKILRELHRYYENLFVRLTSLKPKRETTQLLNGFLMPNTIRRNFHAQKNHNEH
jgi:hypothetical protein